MSSELLRVVVCGAGGLTGREAVAAIEAAEGMQLVAALHRQSDVPAVLAAKRPRVLVDFTVAAAARDHARMALEAGASPVIGTSGLEPEWIDALAKSCGERGVGGAVIPNFAMGAALLSLLAASAAPYFDEVEIEERHHSGKLDSPSGTAAATARAIARSRREAGCSDPAAAPAGHLARGLLVEGIPVHSLRLSGVMAEQEVVLSSAGQTLSLVHRTVNRACYGPGLVATIRAVTSGGFYRSLVEVLGIGTPLTLAGP